MAKFRRTPVWHRRLTKKINPAVAKFTNSTTEDKLLIYYDIICSQAHCEMLRKQKLMSKSEYSKIRKALNKILNEFRQGRFTLNPEYEDVHMNVEFHLRKKTGLIAEKLHTARSRNDLIATELRLYCRDRIYEILKKIFKLQKAILYQARRDRDTIVPGYTHLQQAQPMLASFYLGSLFHKFQRDFIRLLSEYDELGVLPLGSCAFAGTKIDIDRKYLALRLGFNDIGKNALDSVSDRDFVIDFLYSLARIMVHISNLAEDLVIFSSNEFKLVELDDSIVTGSSIMPQKRNPDICELLRAKTAKAFGRLTGALGILKGLPSSYNRDLQELKPILFEQVAETSDCIDVTRLVVLNMRFYTPNQEWAKKPNFICATDLVEKFVKKGYRFRDIYNLVSECIKNARGDIEKFIGLIAKKTGATPREITESLTPESSVRTKISEAGTGLDTVKSSLKLMATEITYNYHKMRNIKSMNPQDSY